MTKVSKDSTPTTSSSLSWIYFGIISIAFFIIYQFVFDKKLDLGGDNAMYYILGKSINIGEGFKNIHLTDVSPHSHFPPGYPLILGIFMFISKSIVFLKIVNGLFLFSTVLLVYKLLIKFTDNQKLAFVSAILILLNTHLLHYGSVLMSEISFTFFTTLSLFLFLKALDKEHFYKNPSFYFLIVVSSFAFHIRTVGIALIAGIVLFLLIKRNWKFLLGYSVGFGLSAVPWMLRNKAVGAASSYSSSLMKINPYRPAEGNMELSDWFTRFFNNFSRYITKEIPNGMFPGIEVDYRADATVMQWLIGILIVSIIIYGLIKLKNYKLILLGYLLGIFGILLLWPDVWYGIRFVLPVIPFLLFLFINGLIALLQFSLSKIKVKTTISPYLGLGLALIFMGQLKDLNEKSSSGYPGSYKNFFEMGNYVNKNLSKDVIISTRKPPLFYLYANRKVQRFAYEKDYNKFMNQLKDGGVTHVIVEQLGFPQTGQYLVPVIQANTERFKGIKTLAAPETYLLEFNGSVGYDGEWKQRTDKDGNPQLSVREGYGKLTYANGNYYEGQFVNNLQHGKGSVKNAQNQIVKEGNWSNGQFVETYSEDVQ